MSESARQWDPYEPGAEPRTREEAAELVGILADAWLHGGVPEGQQQRVAEEINRLRQSWGLGAAQPFVVHGPECRMTLCALDDCTAVVCRDHDVHEEMPDGQLVCGSPRHDV